MILLKQAVTKSLSMGTLRVHGPDSKGIVAACSQVLNDGGCEIINSEQWTDRNNVRNNKKDVGSGRFFQRFQFTYPFMSTTTTTTDLALKNICSKFNLKYDLNWRNRKKRVGIMVSKYDHCLWELLLKHRAKELDCDIPVVLSNHNDLENVVTKNFQIPFHCVGPITSENKSEQEAIQLQLLQQTYDVDVVVLARYMQVLSTNFLTAMKEQNIINIHHSFLPAFSGRKPYHRAFERGVKLIGATAHYTTAQLDDGPIIEQDVIRVSHRDEIKDLMRKGRILERNVLIRALQAHLDDRIIVHGDKCVVFSD